MVDLLVVKTKSVVRLQLPASSYRSYNDNENVMTMSLYLAAVGGLPRRRP